MSGTIYKYEEEQIRKILGDDPPEGLRPFLAKSDDDWQYVLHTLYAARTAIRMLGPVGSRAIAELVMWLTKQSAPSKEESKRVWDVINQLYTVMPEPIEEQVLEASYTMLLYGDISRAEVAELASRRLKRSISTEAWRKAVDRWADSKGMPRPVRRQRKSKDKTEGAKD